MGDWHQGFKGFAMKRSTCCILLPLLAACGGEPDSEVTPDACEGALTDERVNVPFECEELGYLVKEAGRQGGTEIILAAGVYVIDGDLALKNDVTFRGEDPGDPPVVQISGEFSALNAVIRDVIIDGTLDAHQTELSRVTAGHATIEDVTASKVDAEKLWVYGEVDLTDVTAQKKLEVEGWGRFTNVVGQSGSALIVGDSTVNGSQLPPTTVRPNTEGRDRVDVVIQGTSILGALTAYGASSGTVYVHLQDSEAHQVVLENDMRAAGLEVEVLRSTLVGAKPAAVDLTEADNYSLTVANSLVFGHRTLLSTGDGDVLTESGELALHNNVFVGGDVKFEQAPECGVESSTALSVHNNIFVDVGLALTLLLDQDLDASHNLFVDSDCSACETVAGDECSRSAPRVPLAVTDTEGSQTVGSAGFVDFDDSDPAGSDLTLTDNSPAVDAGVPEWSDPDGTRSDMGVYGGPDAL